MKTNHAALSAIGMLERDADKVLVRNETLSDLREQQKRRLHKAYEQKRILGMIKNEEWTFATKKFKGGSCILLAKRKYSYDKYREVCREGARLKFQTKTSAHNAAKAIHELGLEDSGYELGEVFNE